jgi:hypothetical protein
MVFKKYYKYFLTGKWQVSLVRVGRGTSDIQWFVMRYLLLVNVPVLEE